MNSIVKASWSHPISLLRGLFAVVTLLLCFSAHSNVLQAQSASAQLSGVVHDEPGAVIPNAQVVVTQIATGVSTKTASNGEGLFVFPALPVGSYTLDVAMAGFESYRQTNVVLTVGQQLQVNIPLKIGGSTETVTVEAAAVAVDVTSPTQQSTVEEKVVRDLPLNGRNPASLTYTVAGVTDTSLNIVPSSSAALTSTVKAVDSSNPQESAPSVHGARPGGTYFSLDGAGNTDPLSVIGGPFPNPDATGEFSVVTGTYGAKYVSAPGGAINIVSRSGTNQFHGTAFEFLRNGAVNARNALSTSPDVLKRNQFGFAAGGPIIHDRLFIFGSYQATPTKNNVTQTAFVPTAAQRAGNFGTFQLSPAMISPSSQKLLASIPLGDPTTGFISYQSPQNSNDQQGLIKVDYNFGNHHLFARSFYDRYVLQNSGGTPSAQYLAVHEGFVQPWLSNAIGDTWTKGAFVFDSRASYVRALATSTVPSGVMSYSSLGLTGLSGTTLSDTVVVGQFQVNAASPTYFPRNELELSENVYATAGRNQISFGAVYRRISLNETNYTANNPVAAYAGVNTLIGEFTYLGCLQAGAPAAYCATIGIATTGAPALNPTADFLMGEPYIFVQQDGLFPHINGNLFGVYGEDNIKLTSKLTATAGLRWDPFFPYTGANNHATCFRPGTQSTVYPNAPTGLVFPGDPNCSSSGMLSSLAEFQPRVGLTYQLDDQGKAVVRAGYGRYDLQFPLNSYLGFSSQPFVREYQLTQPGLNIDNLWKSAGLTDPFSSGFRNGNYTAPQNVAFQTGLQAATFDANFHPGYIQQWSLSLQRLLSSTDSVDIAYNGTEGTHLPITGSFNTAVNGTAPFPKFGIISDLTSIGTSSYNGVDITYRHRGKIFTLTPAFSWSKALDDSSQPATTLSSSIVLPNTTNHNFRRALSDFDQKYEFRTTGTYSSPSLAGREKALREVAGSWLVSTLIVVDSGQPFSVIDAGNFSGTGLGIDLADRVPGVPTYMHGRLNPAAFKDNAAGTFGNSGRNAYRGPSYKDVDVAVSKDFPVYKEFATTFRAEAFNLFNHPNFLPPNNNYAAPPSSFATYQYARDPRILQFSLKASF